MKRKLPRNIERIEHHHFRGYVVRAKRRGLLYERYFRDGDDRKVALERAVRFCDRLLTTLPRPRKFHTRSTRSSTGIVGVVLRDERSRSGTRVRFYTATWHDKTGRRRTRTFSVQRYGKERALALAVATRTRMLKELLRPQRPQHGPLIAPRRSRSRGTDETDAPRRTLAKETVSPSRRSR